MYQFLVGIKTAEVYSLILFSYKEFASLTVNFNCYNNFPKENIPILKGLLGRSRANSYHKRGDLLVFYL